MRRSVAVAVSFVVVVSACGSSEQEPAEPTTVPAVVEAEAARPLADLPPRERLGGAYRIVEAGLPPAEAVSQLGDVLQAEVAEPSPGRRFGWLEYSETLQEAYMAAMVGLGPDAVPEIRRRAATADGVVRAWYVVALGYLGEDVDEDLLALLADPPSRPVAAHVMELAGRLRLEAAVPMLEDYLRDDYSVQDPHRADRPPDYPMRDHAAAALRELGFAVASDRDRPGEYRVVAP